MPSISSSGIDSTMPLRKPITWVRILRPDERQHFAKISHGDGWAAGRDQHAHKLYDFAGPRQQCRITDPTM